MDAYLEWLEIPRHKRPAAQLPPHHYDLLGIELFSSNWTLIKSQYDRRMELVKSHELGPHASLSQKLLKELALARTVLLDPERKRKYDIELRMALGLPAADAVGPPAAEVPVSESPADIDRVVPLPAKVLGKKRKPKQPKAPQSSPQQPVPINAVLAGVAGLLAVIVVGLITWQLLPKATPATVIPSEPVVENQTSQLTPAATVERSLETEAHDTPVVPVQLSRENMVPMTTATDNAQRVVPMPIPTAETDNSGLAGSDLKVHSQSSLQMASVNSLSPPERLAPDRSEPKSFERAKPPSNRVTAIPPVKTPVTDGELSDFITLANRERTGDAGHQVFQNFVQSHEFDAKQSARVDQALADWKLRDEQGLCRIGAKWMPESNAVTTKSGVDDKVSQAEQFIMARQYSQAYELLESANQDDPGRVKTLYLLGLLHSLPVAGANAADKAEKYFDRVLRIEPDHPEALNSLAISLIKQASFPGAVTRFRRSAEGLPDCSVVAHNVRRLLDLLTDGTYKFEQSGNVKRQCQDLLKELEDQGRIKNRSLSGSWLHMIPVFSTYERVGRDNGVLGKRTSGLGFAVAPNLVVTTRRSVYSESLGVASDVLLTPLENSEEEVHGQVVSLPDDLDLAIIHAPQLGAAPLKVGGATPAQAELLNVIYRNSPSRFDITREVVEIVAAPDASRVSVPGSYLLQTSQLLTFAEGAALDNDGALIAMLAGVFPGESESLLYGVTAEKIRESLAPLAELEELDAVATVEDPTRSSFRVVAEYEAGSVSLASLGLEGNTFNDRTCVNCNGHRVIDCPGDGRSCNQGKVTEKYFVTAVVGVGDGARQVQQQRFRPVNCPICGAKGVLDCPACDDGTQ